MRRVLLEIRKELQQKIENRDLGLLPVLWNNTSELEMEYTSRHGQTISIEVQIDRIEIIHHEIESAGFENPKFIEEAVAIVERLANSR